MSDNDGEQKSDNSSRARDHMANERTFLAWTRTSIGIIAFGFVIERFALFMKQMASFLGESHSELLSNTAPQSYSSMFGILLVVLGVLISVFAFIKCKKVGNQIEAGMYKPSVLLSFMLTLSVLLIGILLVIYLNNTI